MRVRGRWLDRLLGLSSCSTSSPSLFCCYRVRCCNIYLQSVLYTAAFHLRDHFSGCIVLGAFKPPDMFQCFTVKHLKQRKTLFINSYWRHWAWMGVYKGPKRIIRYNNKCNLLQLCALSLWISHISGWKMGVTWWCKCNPSKHWSEIVALTRQNELTYLYLNMMWTCKGVFSLLCCISSGCEPVMTGRPLDDRLVQL